MIKIKYKETPLQCLIFRSNRYQRASWGNRTNCITLLICSDLYISTHQYKRPTWKKSTFSGPYLLGIWCLADKKTYTDFIWFHQSPTCLQADIIFLHRNHFWWLPDLISSSGEWVLFELLERGVPRMDKSVKEKGLTGQRSRRAPLLALSWKWPWEWLSAR